MDDTIDTKIYEVNSINQIQSNRSAHQYDTKSTNATDHTISTSTPTSMSNDEMDMDNTSTYDNMNDDEMMLAHGGL